MAKESNDKKVFQNFKKSKNGKNANKTKNFIFKQYKIFTKNSTSKIFSYFGGQKSVVKENLLSTNQILNDKFVHRMERTQHLKTSKLTRSVLPPPPSVEK